MFAETSKNNQMLKSMSNLSDRKSQNILITTEVEGKFQTENSDQRNYEI